MEKNLTSIGKDSSTSIVPPVYVMISVFFPSLPAPSPNLLRSKSLRDIFRVLTQK